MCGCGSGLRALRCCALDLQQIPQATAVAHLLPLIERALQAHGQGDTALAEQLCLDVLELAPDRPRFLALLAVIRQGQGRLDAAAALLGRILLFDPNNLAATRQLALLQLGRGRPAEALVHGRNAVRIAPEDAQSHNILAMALTETNAPHFGEFHYRRALALSGARDPILLANLAWALKNQGRMQEARALYAESVAASPAVFQTLLGFARLEEADRDFAAAEALLDRLDDVAPGHPAARLARAVLFGRTGREAEAVALLEGLRDSGMGPEELLEKGRLLDRLGRHADAFSAFLDGKALALRMTGAAYAEAEVRGLFQRLAGFFTAERLALLPRAGVRRDVPQPIFILGFPRSGTTLVEQTLSAHSRIAAGDELPVISDITQAMPRMLNSPLPYPEALAELWMADQVEGLDTLRDHYLQRVRQMGVLREGADLFTDKMPLNETHLGLIALMFPQAPLVHVIRHPLDVMVSAMSNLFTHGYFCASSLEAAARHYVAVTELVLHYRRALPMRYLAVRYEGLVADQEATVRGLLDFVGVDFEPGCLRFHENRRHARTASYAQVTERLYDRSLYRHRHYRAQLAPVLPILQPVIDRLGYGAQ